MALEYPKKRITARELMVQLQQNAEYTTRLKEEHQKREAASEKRRLAALPVLEELRAAGCAVDSLDLHEQPSGAFKKSIPILLSWLPKITDVDVKESIVRSLSVPSAKPIAAGPLIVEFRNTPNTANSGLKWVIGNALSVVATDAVFEKLLELIKDTKNGKSREMLVLALGNMENTAAVDTLIELLNDEEVAGHALMALGKLQARKALPYIKHFVNHPKAWIRKEAKRTLVKIEQ